jgi:hypothetical protein
VSAQCASLELGTTTVKNITTQPSPFTGRWSPPRWQYIGPFANDSSCFYWPNAFGGFLEQVLTPQLMYDAGGGIAAFQDTYAAVSVNQPPPQSACFQGWYP